MNAMTKEQKIAHIRKRARQPLNVKRTLKDEPLLHMKLRAMREGKTK